MTNSLDKFPHIPFERAAVSKRIKETKAILSSLTLISEHPDGEHRLYQDPSTGELWQFARAWNWGAEPYCFLVPSIEPGQWQQEPFVDPDELLVFVAGMQRFLAQPAVKQVPNLKAHVENLQQVKMLPRNPKGRWFGPYKKENILPHLDHRLLPRRPWAVRRRA